MAKQKLSMSEKIRRQLAQGKSVKEISKSLKCSAGLVYAVRSSDKKKNEPKKIVVKKWEAAAYSTSPEALNTKQRQVLDALAAKPGAVRYGDVVMVPKDYAQAKPTLFQRIKNFLGV